MKPYSNHDCTHREILQSEYIRTEMDFYRDYLEGCLTFINPTHYDNGNYTLQASNSLGTITKTVYGHFLTAPPFDPDPDGNQNIFLDRDTSFSKSYRSQNSEK